MNADRFFHRRTASTIHRRRWPTALLLLALVAAGPAVAAEAQVQDLDALRLTALDYLRTRLRDSGAQIEVNGVDPRLRLWACESAIEAALAPGASLRGRTAVVLRCPAPAWKLVLSAQVRVERSVVVAARPLARGTVLGAGDLKLAGTDATQPGSGDWLDDPRPAVGRVLQTALAVDAPVPSDALAEPLTVRRGETVELVVWRAGMRISATGVALADGRPGERLRAKNLASGRAVEGRLQGERTLVVD